jgi:predicted TIM-barrel fold metal-dependent hydrolase
MRAAETRRRSCVPSPEQVARQVFQHDGRNGRARSWTLPSKPNSGRKFAIKYQDRILFGTDAPIGQSMYEGYFRTLETDDDLIDTRRTWGPTFGLNLPDEVLQKIYSGNARKVFPSLR